MEDDLGANPDRQTQEIECPHSLVESGKCFFLNCPLKMLEELLMEISSKIRKDTGMTTSLSADPSVSWACAKPPESPHSLQTNI